MYYMLHFAVEIEDIDMLVVEPFQTFSLSEFREENKTIFPHLQRIYAFFFFLSLVN